MTQRKPRTDSDLLKTLEERRDYLRGRIQEPDAAVGTTRWHKREIRALFWAIAVINANPESARAIANTDNY